jgi:hypothetical protein
MVKRTMGSGWLAAMVYCISIWIRTFLLAGETYGVSRLGKSQWGTNSTFSEAAK